MNSADITIALRVLGCEEGARKLASIGDSTGTMSAKVAQDMERISASLSRLSGTSGATVKLRTELQTSDIDREFHDLERRVAERRIKLALDTPTFRAELKSIEQELDAVKTRAIGMVDTDKGRRKIRDELGDFHERAAALAVTADPNKAKALRSELDSNRDRLVKLVATADPTEVKELQALLDGITGRAYKVSVSTTGTIESELARVQERIGQLTGRGAKITTEFEAESLQKMQAQLNAWQDPKKLKFATEADLTAINTLQTEREKIKEAITLRVLTDDTAVVGLQAKIDGIERKVEVGVATKADLTELQEAQRVLNEIKAGVKSRIEFEIDDSKLKAVEQQVDELNAKPFSLRTADENAQLEKLLALQREAGNFKRTLTAEEQSQMRVLQTQAEQLENTLAGKRSAEGIRQNTDGIERMGYQSFRAARMGNMFAESMVKAVVPVGALGEKLFMVDNLMMMMEMRGRNFASVLSKSVLAAMPMALAIGAVGGSVVLLTKEFQIFAASGAKTFEELNLGAHGFFQNFLVGAGWIDLAGQKIEKLEVYLKRLERVRERPISKLDNAAAVTASSDPDRTRFEQEANKLRENRARTRAANAEEIKELEKERDRIGKMSMVERFTSYKELGELYKQHTGKEVPSAGTNAGHFGQFLMPHGAIQGEWDRQKMVSEIQDAINDKIRERMELIKKADQGETAALLKLRDEFTTESLKKLLGEEEFKVRVTPDMQLFQKELLLAEAREDFELKLARKAGEPQIVREVIRDRQRAEGVNRNDPRGKEIEAEVQREAQLAEIAWTASWSKFTGNRMSAEDIFQAKLKEDATLLQRAKLGDLEAQAKVRDLYRKSAFEAEVQNIEYLQKIAAASGRRNITAEVKAEWQANGKTSAMQAGGAKDFEIEAAQQREADLRERQRQIQIASIEGRPTDYLNKLVTERETEMRRGGEWADLDAVPELKGDDEAKRAYLRNQLTDEAKELELQEKTRLARLAGNVELRGELELRERRKTKRMEGETPAEYDARINKAVTPQEEKIERRVGMVSGAMNRAAGEWGATYENRGRLAGMTDVNSAEAYRNRAEFGQKRDTDKIMADQLKQLFAIQRTLEQVRAALIGDGAGGEN